jgi:Sec-independent protein translocase protein TatA
MIVVAVISILMGPDKIPDASRKLGATWRAIKEFQQKIESEVREAVPQLPDSGEISRLVRKPFDFLNQLADQSETGNEVSPEFYADDRIGMFGPIARAKQLAESKKINEAESPTTFDHSLNQLADQSETGNEVSPEFYADYRIGTFGAIARAKQLAESKKINEAESPTTFDPSLN